eukprot:CAMPEP_0176274254 /NCGR_PEP_ID=MMETSP0121_2-20121125/46634_1 /TAXON_ID=160619 /ORGANISM="Kryptoperidinium foliaceum, Strain CCMP 1326" /LENGTH=48 /DNA_ID= /DNA_START= /DNA_END= /DNA_ORIENTATION=
MPTSRAASARNIWPLPGAPVARVSWTLYHSPLVLTLLLVELALLLRRG